MGAIMPRKPDSLRTQQDFHLRLQLFRWGHCAGICCQYDDFLLIMSEAMQIDGAPSGTVAERDGDLLDQYFVQSDGFKAYVDGFCKAEHCLFDGHDV